MRHQKCRELWIREDSNTKLYLLLTIIKRRRNTTAEIKLPSGEYIWGKNQLEDYFIKGFRSLFDSSNNTFPRGLKDLIEGVIIKEENGGLCYSIPRGDKENTIWLVKSQGPWS